MTEVNNQVFNIKRFAYINDLFCVLLRASIMGLSILFLVNFLITRNSTNVIVSVIGFIVSCYLVFGDYFNGLKVTNKKIIIKSLIDSYVIELSKIKSVSIIGVSQKDSTKDFLFEFLDEDDEPTKVKVKSVIDSKKLEEFLNNNNIDVSNSMKRGVNMKPIKLIAGIAIVIVIILAIIYSINLWGSSENNKDNVLKTGIQIPQENSQVVSTPQSIGVFPLPKATIEQTGFNVDKVHLNSRKVYAFTSDDKKMYSFAYVFSPNVRNTDLFICFDLDCNLYSVFHLDKEKLTNEPVTFEAGSNSPLNNFPLQTSVMEVMGLVMLSIEHESFDNELFPIFKVAITEIDNKDQEQNFVYDFNP